MRAAQGRAALLVEDAGRLAVRARGRGITNAVHGVPGEAA
jgi:hypothetical protein